MASEVLDTTKQLVRTSGNELIANLMAINLYPLGILKDRSSGYPHPPHSTNPRPVLLVHGIVHDRSAFLNLKKRLEKHGWHNIYTINYQTRHGSLSHMVGNLAKRVNYILKETKASQIDIIAHSLGGLVARYFMSIGNGRGKIKDLITLGTPHNGSKLSSILRYLPGSSLAYDLAHDSHFLKLLQETKLPVGSRITNIYSPYDWTNWPRVKCTVSGHPKEAFENVCIDSVGHTGFLFSQQVLDRILSTIGNQSFLSN